MDAVKHKEEGASMRFDIRREAEEDFRAVEELTREAFWNLNSPGCEEHYLVHILRSHADFLPELDLVATHGAEIAASILYSRSRVEDVPTVTFGPLSVLPAYQRMGAGSALVRHTLSLCRERESAPSSFTATRPITPGSAFARRRSSTFAPPTACTPPPCKCWNCGQIPWRACMAAF